MEKKVKKTVVTKATKVVKEAKSKVKTPSKTINPKDKGEVIVNAVKNSVEKCVKELSDKPKKCQGNCGCNNTKEQNSTDAKVKEDVKVEAKKAEKDCKPCAVLAAVRRICRIFKSDK